MSRLIDADKLVDMLYDNEFAMLCPLDEVSGVIDACPTVDAVQVIRCRNCKYRDGTPGQLNIQCGNMHDDDFCSHGERKDKTNES